MGEGRKEERGREGGMEGRKERGMEGRKGEKRGMEGREKRERWKGGRKERGMEGRKEGWKGGRDRWKEERSSVGGRRDSCSHLIQMYIFYLKRLAVLKVITILNMSVILTVAKGALIMRRQPC